MRRTRCTLLSLTLLSMSWAVPVTAQSPDSTWTLERARDLAAAYNDPARWDMDQLVADTEAFAQAERGRYPLYSTAHPIADTGTPGLGIGGLPPQYGFQIGGRIVATTFASFSSGRYMGLARAEAGAGEDESVQVLSIFALAESSEYEPSMLASSRSRPHPVWQGIVDQNAAIPIEWVAFHTADQNSYAVINGRLFDLRAGRAIWVVTMQDGSIRYFQDTEVGLMTEAELLAYIQAIPEREAAVAFFTQDGSIDQVHGSTGGSER